MSNYIKFYNLRCIKNSIYILIFFCFNLIHSQISYSVCDDDYDGIYSFSKEDFDRIIALYNVENQESAEIYITSYLDGILKVKDVTSNNPVLEYICKATPESPTFFEIATNSKKEIFISTGERTIFKIDEATCTKTPMNNPATTDIQALSFDRLDNLYKSNGNSVVSRAANNDFDNFLPWHDFGDGYPSGDFVAVGDKMYIAWAESYFSSKNYLYEVTVDENFNYISHINLGRIKDDTWGLASEYGKLYGVTKSELYEINIENLSTRTILSNPSTERGKQWWGAAGKHEAQKIEITFFESYEDAVNSINIMQFPYTNKIPLNQRIYLRYENIYSSEVKITPIDLQINLPPILNIANEYTLCYNGDFSTVLIDSKLPQDNYNFKWFYENAELPNDKPSLSTQLPGNYKLVVSNKETNCFAERSFTLKQSNIFISNVTSSQDFVHVYADGTDHPFTYILDGISQQNPKFDTFPIGEISLFVENAKKCVSKEYLKTIHINNIISPNNDGFNDVFQLKFPIFKNSDYEIKILNKYGEVIHQNKLDQNFKWNGKSSAGQPISSGTYWYIIFSPTNQKKYTGFILLKNY